MATVAMGVSLVVVLAGLAHGSIDDVAGRIQRVGSDILFQPPGASAFFALNLGGMPEGLERELLGVPGVAMVAPVLTGHVSRFRGENKFINVFGIAPESYSRVGVGLEILEGRPLEEELDLVVDTVLAAANELEVGQGVRLLNREFRVAGICRAGSGARIYTRLDTLQKATGREGQVSLFFVKAQLNVPVPRVTADLEKRFEGYRVTALEAFADVMRENAVGLKEFVRVLSGLASMVSFLVVLLSMYTSVLERTQEIGVLRALGATKLMVFRIVVVESLLVAAIGVAAGFFLSILIRGAVLSFFPTLAVALLPRWFLASAAVGILGSVLGGAYPAWRAARLDPARALSFD